MYETAKGGPGEDIYYKGAWMLHTLRWLIGDEAFGRAMRLEVYGREDPRPGNFTQRFGSTREFEGFVRRVTGRDYTWFFDMYLRQAALPELIATSPDPYVLELKWTTASGSPFPMPVEVQIGDKIERVSMTDPAGAIVVTNGAHIVIDPFARVLKRSQAVEEYQAWREAQKSKPKP